MIRVCHITSAHRPEDVRIFHKECVSLAKAGYETYLVQQGDSYEKNGVHIVGLGQPPAGRLKRMATFTKIAYKAALALDADLYHFHDSELLPYGLKLKKKGKKVIFDSHEDTLHSIMKKEWLPKVLRKAVYLGFEREQTSVCRQIDAVISVSPHIVNYFRTLNPRTVQVTNYPIFKEDLPIPAYQDRKKELVFAGGVVRSWNHHCVLQALERFPDYRYRFCGKADNGYLQELQSYPAWKQVEFLGLLPHEAVDDLLCQGSIGMSVLSYHPNYDWKNGSLGHNKIFEEMMAGLPVICTDFVLWREFVERWHCGICVEPENPEAIADAIQYLLDHPEEACRMGENGQKAVKEEFNWGVEEKKLLALYEEILKK